jgi:NTP pyrophosphatase (non-canonical NTP hydrolase)
MDNILKKMEEQVVREMKNYHQLRGTKLWDYRIAARDLVCQVGSLNKLIMQLEGERFKHQKTQGQIKEEIADELADILSMVLFIAHELNIDIQEAWDGMLQSDEQKFKVARYLENT